MPKKEKENTGRLKDKDKKIKARASRNKSKRMEKYKQEMEKRQRPNSGGGDKLKRERQGPDSTTQESPRFRAETEHDNQRNPPPSRTVTTELCQEKRRRIQACSHNRVGIIIYIMGVGGGQKQEGVGNPVLVPVRSGTE